ncbi:MAG: 50S ribosomal protein L13 [Dehalococcoidia bacterium]|nr:MAG: 50S ribosomal protein L13 [Dehalococcoidia bacterium]
MKTYSVKASEIKRDWHIIDGKGKVLGLLATDIARLLMGKHKTTFSRHMDTGDFVVVINAEKINVSGNKENQKLYYRHSGYPGSLKSITLGAMLKTKPERVIEHAVKGMLPKNRLGKSMIKKLKVYAGDSHPYLTQIGASK